MALDVTDDRVRAVAARLHDGGWSFTARQLYYAVCAAVETEPVRVGSGEVGIGVLLILVGAITGQRLLLEILGAAGLVLVIVGVITHLQERRPRSLIRPLTMSFADFEQRFAAAAAGCPGLIAAMATAPAPVAADATLVVCDRSETAALLIANRAHLGEVAVAALAWVDQLAGRRVIALHDCDPAGCALVAELGERGADVVDAGINPRDLVGRRLQLIEGAPARTPRDLSGHLGADENDWLRSGRRLECATETPEQLALRVQAALSGLHGEGGRDAAGDR
ncbi:MAG: hypothetical protein ACRENL_08785 [Candidatus Dormibacteria bacterium]